MENLETEENVEDVEENVEDTENLENQDNPTDEVEDQDDENEITVSFGDDEDAEEARPEEKAPGWVKKLRKENREKVKEIKRLQQQLAEHTASEQPDRVLVKPTLADADVDYDQDAFEAKWVRWQETQAELAKEKAEWDKKNASYNETKKSLGAKDYDEVEDMVKSTLSVEQQGVLMHTAKNPALVVYALGKSEQKTKALSEIKDPLKLAYELGKIDSKLVVEKRKPRTKPETVVTGNTSTTGSVDRTLDKLRANAARTGDYSQVMEYKRKFRAKK